jgi:hypothetical protein
MLKIYMQFGSFFFTFGELMCRLGNFMCSLGWFSATRAKFGGTRTIMRKAADFDKQTTITFLHPEFDEPVMGQRPKQDRDAFTSPMGLKGH